MNYSKKILPVLLIFICAGVGAKGLAPIAKPQPGGFKVGYFSNGQPSITATGAAGGVVAMGGVAVMQITPSVVAEAAVTGAITGGAAGAAWAVGVATIGVLAMSAIPAIKQWMETAGARINIDGSVQTQVSPTNQYAGLGCRSAAPTDHHTFFPTQSGNGGPLLPGYACGEIGSYATGFNYAGSIYSDPGFTPVPVWSPSTAAQAAAVLSSAAPTQDAVQALVDAGFPPAVSNVQVVAPAPLFVGNTVQLNADGSLTQTTQTAVWTAFDDNLYVNLRKDFKTVNAGNTAQSTAAISTLNSDGTTTVRTVTTVTTTDPSVTTGTYASPKGEPTVCGLPGTPACKIDETGTPDGKTATPDDALKAEWQKAFDALPVITSPVGKDTSWGVMPEWTQQGTCTAWHIYTLPADLGSRNVDLDLCPVKPYADGASNFIWVALAFFGITSMVFSTMSGKGT